MLDYSKRKCYGFIKTTDTKFVINEIEATNVKLIFECFLNGMSLSQIVSSLFEKGIASPSGKDTWSRKVISSTLSNEKYHIYSMISHSIFISAQSAKIKRTATSSSEENSQVAIEFIVGDNDIQSEVVANLEKTDDNICNIIVGTATISMSNALVTRSDKPLQQRIKIFLYYPLLIRSKIIEYLKIDANQIYEKPQVDFDNYLVRDQVLLPFLLFENPIRFHQFCTL